MSGLFPPSALDRIRAGRRIGNRHLLDAAAWAALAEAPPTPAEAPLLAMWGDEAGAVHALFHEGRARPLIASVQTEGLRYGALSARLPAATAYERRIRDLFGFEAMFGVDARPLLDTGDWANSFPLAARPGPAGRPQPVEWLETEPAPETVLVEAGPVGGPLPGLRVRATLGGTTVMRLELAHGVAHRGTENAAVGLAAPFAARLAARVDAESGYAHALAFARAVEGATGVELPPRAAFLRPLALETFDAAAQAAILARAAVAASADLLATVAGRLAADWRNTAEIVFGHRYGADFVVPGGVARDPDDLSLRLLGDLAARTEAGLPRLAAVYEGAAGLAPVLGDSGRISPGRAAALSAGGVIARAAGSTWDARRALARAVEPEPPPPLGSERGTADARLRLRIAALGEAAARIRRLLASPPPGAVVVRPPIEGGEGIGVAEGPNGDVWHVLRLAADGTVVELAVRDPSLVHVTLASEAAVGCDIGLLGPVLHSFGLSAEAIEL